MIYKIEIPESLRTCAGLPKKPSGQYSQREVMEFIARLDESRRDCKTKLELLVGMIDKSNANAQKVLNEKNKR